MMDSMLASMGWYPVECPNCGHNVCTEVHGHYQCSECGRVLEDCCAQSEPRPEVPTVDLTRTVDAR